MISIFKLKFVFTVYKRASITFKKPTVNREKKAVSDERKTKQTRSTIKDVVICKPKPLPGPLLRYGKKTKEVKDDIKLAWTVSQLYKFLPGATHERYLTYLFLISITSPHRSAIHSSGQKRC
jgi:hypothetical protein